MKKLRILLCIMIALITFTGCTPDSSEVEKKYSVTFVENGGPDVEDIKDIEKGSTVNLPNIEKTGYVFKGWFTSKKFISGTEVTSDTKIGKDITVYAKWEALKYNISIDLAGGKMESVYQDGKNLVDYGTEFELPMPTKEGYLFEGWYINNQLIEETIVINQDLDIVSKWIDISTLKASYNLTLNLDGGSLYLYNSKEELMEEFFADYSSFVGRSVDSTNFWDISYRSISGHNGFFGESIYREKWLFFVEYLSTTARPENQSYLKLLVESASYDRGYEEMVRTVTRNEILAFFLNTERVVPGWGSMISGNYAKEELQTGYLAYCKIDTPTSYVTGVGIELKEPIKEGYVFLGWYANSDFGGKTYTSVTLNEYGDKSFYALWGRVE
ncbi:MAG: InlB B-repeat-containing protein [Bacilli bacterium]|nr:InlB B-repeat-containing protein [Bacilli bacterium]